MGYMTIQELAEKFTNILKKRRDIDLGAKIYAASVADQGDSEYPPGTVLFECQSLDSKEPDHLLTIFPDKIGKLQ